MKTILLADDSITIQKVVELTFSDGDYRVFCAGNGTQALRRASELRPDVILLDVIMPEKNGYEVCAALKQDPRTAGIPVLLLIGTFEPFDARRAEQAGASGHLTKPFESHALVARVEELLAQASARPAAPPPAPEPEPIDRPSDAALGATVATAAIEMEMEDERPPSPPLPPPVDAVPPRRHPAFQPPDMSEGGAYLGFADLSVGESEENIAADRSEEAAAPAPLGAMEGFVPGLEMQDHGSAPRYRSDARPLSAPPFEPMAETRSAEPPAAAAGELSDQTLDRLAEMIVRRMTDRVVREIAWEILPGVAESVVRQRIKELEERGR